MSCRPRRSSPISTGCPRASSICRPATPASPRRSKQPPNKGGNRHIEDALAGLRVEEARLTGLFIHVPDVLEQLPRAALFLPDDGVFDGDFPWRLRVRLERGGADFAG